ncbi:MMPL family transporter [Paenibacillus methanolicus]|uniref:RND superfamily putative drug exporter n=1 Tax=Paenibacillus methanolicus TaxID=582686 RepID=A0A5S5CIB8_9BACL|nr:MMPL family transporter [Paenibacillus methanolicus]TYP79536.1 RND superfamily putative drug exporter [Paenibacillus methanolicus]
MESNSWLAKYGSLVAGKRTRWITIFAWILLAAVLSMTLPQVGSKEINNAPNLKDDLPSVQAAAIIKEQFPSESGLPALIVWHRDSGLTAEDLAAVQGLAQQLTDSPVEGQSSTVPLHQMPVDALRAQVSEDGTTLIQPMFFDESADAEVMESSLEQIKTLGDEAAGAKPFEAETDGGELSARITGPAGIAVDASALFSGADVSLLIATVVIVLVILLAIYRSPILALIPLVGVAFAYAVTSPLLGWMAGEGWITVDSQGISIMTVLLFGAGTDYCLFLISHFRTELTRHENKLTALIHAIKDATGAVAMSGFTVVLSLLALLLAEYGAYHRFAVPFSLSIFIMGIASITLVPALLSVFGRASFFPFIPRTPEMKRERAIRKGKPVPKETPQRGFGQAIGGLVTRKPWTVTIVSVVILGALAGFAPAINYNYDILSSFPKTMDSREGNDLIGEAFSPGSLAPVTVVVDTEGKDVNLASVFEADDKIASVSGKPESGATEPNLQSYSITLAMNPYSLDAMSYIPELQARAENELKASGIAEPRVWVGGQTAEQHDTKTVGDQDRNLIIPVVTVLIALLLLVYLRSFVAMLYLIATVLLSYGAALGLGWIIIHYLMGADGIQGSIPLYAFVFLVALGEDYNIFMISSIWQKRKTMPLRQAIREGVADTGGVITSAGLILAATFAVLATLPIQVLVQFGIITAIGVLLDTFVVRPFLVPAITVLLGKTAFWPGRVYEPAASGKAERVTRAYRG